ncbi:hypothetical protein ABZP36_004900 [Zizania latifolia]
MRAMGVAFIIGGEASGRARRSVATLGVARRQASSVLQFTTLQLARNRPSLPVSTWTVPILTMASPALVLRDEHGGRIVGGEGLVGGKDAAAGQEVLEVAGVERVQLVSMATMFTLPSGHSCASRDDMAKSSAVSWLLLPLL